MKTRIKIAGFMIGMIVGAASYLASYTIIGNSEPFLTLALACSIFLVVRTSFTILMDIRSGNES